MRGGIRRGTTNADTATDTDTITKETAVGSGRGGGVGETGRQKEAAVHQNG